jgi:hypothetical protein
MKFTRPLLIAVAMLAVVGALASAVMQRPLFSVALCSDGARARDFVRLTILPDKELS